VTRARGLPRRAFVAGAAATTLVAAAGCAGAPVTDAADKKAPQPLLHGLADFDGKKLDAPKVLGKVALIDFWASWCGPCRQSFPHLDQLFRTYAGDGLLMMGVCVDDDPALGRRFWAQLRPRFPVGWDAEGEVRERFGVVSLPTTVLLDTGGFVVQRNEGFDPGDHRILEENVHRLLRG
jgi:cytochrome c biogenesis protein CcmG/thiol:disulfide interchange protein DsbE